MDKPTYQIYLNNTIAFFIFLFLRLIFRKNTYPSSRTLFINTGQIGDIVVSSVIFRNQDLLQSFGESFFLVRREYRELFDDYQGPIKLLFWDYNKYKYNPFYRIKFLLELKSLRFGRCMNLTAARGITNDELTILSGASEVMCLKNNWRYLTKLFGQQMDSRHDKVLSFDTINEPLRNVKVLEHLTGKKVDTRTVVFIKQSTKERAVEKLRSNWKIGHSRKVVAIAPLSDGELRNWKMDYFAELCKRIVVDLSASIVLLGTQSQWKKLDMLTNIDKQAIYNTAGHFSVLESASIVEMADLFIGNDSGFTHIAKALRKKFIGIIGGGCYGLFFPYEGTNDDNLLFYKLNCFGCEWRCILEQPFCVYNVTVDQVYAKVAKLLA